MSIAFDYESHTVSVTGKPLEFGDRHFPAPTELIIGSAPSDAILTYRQSREKRDTDDWDDDFEKWGKCLFIHSLETCAEKAVKKELAKISFDFESPDKQIDFTSKEPSEERKQYWPME